MAIDPSIALGVKPIELPNQLAQYGQVAQLLAARDTQQLNALKMQEYERTRAEEEGTKNFLSGRKDLYAPEVRTGLLQFGETGRKIAKNISEQETSAANLKKLSLETDQKAFDLQNSKLKHGWQSLGEAATPQAAIEKLNDGADKGYFDRKTADAEIQQLQNMPLEQYKQYRVQKILGLLDAKDQLAAMSPKITRQDIGGQITNIQDNPLLPGYGLPVQGMAAIAKTMTPGEVASNKIATERVGLERQRVGLEGQRVGLEGQRVDLARKESERKQAGLEALPPKEVQKREAAYPQATSALKGFEDKSDAFVKDLEKLRDHPGLSQITGFIAGRAPALTADGRAAQALYDKIVAKGGFQALQDMRDASKTGGALGNVSNQEGKQLTASFAAIDRRQDAKDVKAALDDAIGSVQGARTRMREAYDSTYSYRAGAAPAAAGGPGVDTSNPLLK